MKKATFVSRIKGKVFAAGAATSALTLTAVNAFADTNSDAIFAAVDLTGFATKVTAVIVVGIGLSLAYAAYRHGKRVLSMS